jgi:F-type H+-transporting ATPase subunit a
MSADIFSYHTIKPFKCIGLDGAFWTLHLDILMASWIAMGVMFVLIFIGRHFIKREYNIVSAGFEQSIGGFMSFFIDTFSYFDYRYFAFIISLFMFTFFSSIIGILPYVEEATRDLNTTLAIGLTSFLYIQYQKIRVHGIGGYLKEFIEPIFILAPIHLVGELSKIASMSFRLFGNILGGGVILSMVVDLLGQYKEYYFIFMLVALLLSLTTHLLPIAKRSKILVNISSMLILIMFLITWLQIALGVVEALIQAFVVTMLTTTYLALGTEHTEDEQHKTHDPKEAT